MTGRDLPRVELPPPEADQPAWGKVGVIAVLGFVIGVAWPRLAGVSLGPNPPSDAPRAAPTGSAAAQAKTALNAAVPADTGAFPAGSAPVGGPSNEQGVSVGPVEITRCRDGKGKSPDNCDKIAVEEVFGSRLKELARCPSALGLSGKVSVGFDLDFKSKTLKVQRAKAKLPRTTLDGLTRCVERSFSGVSLDEIQHENTRYSLAFDVTFLPPGRAAEGEPGAQPEGDKETALDGKTAKITWGSCQVREAPNGNVVGKLPRNTEVKLLASKAGWFKIEYGDKKQGWIFGGAIGQ